MKKILRLLLAAVLALALAAAAGCGGAEKTENKAENKTEKPVLKVGYLPITHSLPLVVADNLNKDKYSNFKLELVKFSSWPELTEALNSGQIQGAVTMFELAMVSAERGVPVEILALSHRNGDAITVANEIASITDLKGKRVAVPHRMSGQNILLYKALKDKGLTLDDVQWVEMPPPDMPAALSRGEIKGYVVAEPFGAKAVLGGYGKTLLKAQDIWPDWICCGLVFNSEFKKNNPEATQEFVDSLVAAGQYIVGNKAQAVKIAQDYMKIEEKVWEKSFEIGVVFSELTPKSEELVRLQDSLLELKLLKGKINIDSILDTSFVTKAYEKVK